MLIEKSNQYPFRLFSEIYSHTINVNWPYDVEDAVTQPGPSGVVSLSPVFEKHVRMLSNWTVTKEFEQYFPDIVRLISLSS